MAVVRNLMVRAGADFSALRSGMRQAQRQISDFGRNVNRTVSGINAALAGIGVGIGLGAAVKDAMDFESSLQQINRLFAESSREFQKWANENASVLGMSRLEIVKYGATYGNLVATFAKGSDEAVKHTEDLLKASAIISAATGRSMEDVGERIRSGLLGNTEAIEDLGVNVNVAMIESTNAFRQFAGDKSWQQLDFQTQQQIRLMAILEQTTQKYGDTLAVNTAATMGSFVAELNNIKIALGQAFLPILNTVLPVLTAFAAKLAQVMSIVAQFSQALFGKTSTSQQVAQANATNQQAKAVDNLGSAIKGTGKSAKKAGKEAEKAKGFLAGFDEINSIVDKSSGGSGSGASAGIGDAAEGINAGGGLTLGDPNAGGIFTEISNKAQEMASKVKGFFSGLKNFLVEHKAIITSVLGGLAAGFAAYMIAIKGATAAKAVWAAIAKVAAAAMVKLRAAFAFLTGPIGLIVAAVALLTAGFIYFYQTNDKFRNFVNGILNKIKDAAVYLWQNALVPLGNYIATGFVAAWEALKVAAEWLWKNVFIPLGNYFIWLWQNALIPIGNVIKDVLVVVFNTLSEVAKSFWKNVMVPLGEFLKAAFKPTIEALSAVFTFLWNNVLEPFGSYLGSAFKARWEAVTQTIEFLWYKVLKPLVSFLGGQFLSSFNNVFEMLGSIIGGLQTTFIGLMDFITGVFTNDWDKAWKGVRQIFKGVFDTLYGIVKRLSLNMIIDAINQVISGLNSISIDIPDWVPNFGGRSFGIRIPRIPKLARGGIVDGPTIAQIGEAGKEMVVPLENTSFVDKLASALGSAVMSAMQFNGGGSTASGDVILQIDGTSIARAIGPYLQKETSRIGGNMIIAK